MNFVTSLKQTKTKTAKQERSIDVQTLSKLFIKWDNKGSYAPSLSLFIITKLMQLPTDHKRPYLEELFFYCWNW